MPAVSHDLGDLYSGGLQMVLGDTPAGDINGGEDLDMEGHGTGHPPMGQLEDGGPSYG